VVLYEHHFHLAPRCPRAGSDKTALARRYALMARLSITTAEREAAFKNLENNSSAKFKV
jgi:hypothetical protein